MQAQHMFLVHTYYDKTLPKDVGKQRVENAQAVTRHSVLEKDVVKQRVEKTIKLCTKAKQ